MKYLIFIITMVLIVSCENNQGLSHKINGHIGYHLSAHTQRSDTCRKIISLDFELDIFTDTLNIDTFLVLFDDGYIYKGNFSKTIHVNSLCLNSTQEDFILYFVGLNIKHQKAYVWSQKRTYNISRSNQYFVVLMEDGSCLILDDNYFNKLLFTCFNRL